MRLSALVAFVRGGDLRVRLPAIRDGTAGVRVSALGAGLRTGVLDRLQRQPQSTVALAEQGDWAGVELLEAFLQVLARFRVVQRTGDQWQLTSRGRALVDDDVARAAYEAFSDFHTGLYRDLEQQLRGGPGRRDVADRGDVIARLSRAMDPFVFSALDLVLRRRRPARVLDVGCGTGSHLLHLLERLPEATGVGVEVDAAAAQLARERMTQAGLAERVHVVEADVRALDPTVADIDLALVANVVYYLSETERIPVLRSIAQRLRVGGVLLVISTALTDVTFSRHFDLLLRAQNGQMALPDLPHLCDQLRAAGLRPGRPRRLAAGEPLMMVMATREEPETGTTDAGRHASASRGTTD